MSKKSDSRKIKWGDAWKAVHETHSYPSFQKQHIFLQETDLLY